MADVEITDGLGSTAFQIAKYTAEKQQSSIEETRQRENIGKAEPSDGTANPDDPSRFNCVPRYNMDSNPRGLCVIINNTFEGRREGTDVDKARLEDTFARLHFDVKCHDNLKANEMRDIIQNIAKQDHGAYDCFACCILSHGDKGLVLGEDWSGVDIHDLTNPLRPRGGGNDHGTCCPSLEGKPKMYFIQACQGKDKDGVHTDDSGPNDRVKPIPNEADFLLSFATVPGYVAWRSPDKGSRYIQKLCDLLDERAYDLDMLEILTLLNDTVGQLPEQSTGTIQKQAPIAMTTLRKKVIFEVLVTGRGVQPKGVRVNDKVDFCVHTEGEVGISITRPDNSDQMCDKRKVDNRWICTYTPSLPGKYTIRLNYSGGVIPKSPIEVEVLPEWKGVPVKAYGPGLQGGRCKQEAVFTVDVDVSSDLDKLSFSLPRSLEEVDRKKRTHDKDAIVELRYRPKYQGQYAVHVLWDGEDIPDSPFMVNIEPAAEFKAEKVDAWGPGLKLDGVVADKRCTFTIDTRRAGKAKLAVKCIDKDQKPVDVKVKDNEDGTYSCSYVPVKHQRHIMYITYGGSSDRNSPFICKPASSSPSTTSQANEESPHPDLSDQSTLQCVGFHIHKAEREQNTRITSLLATDCGRLLIADIWKRTVEVLELSTLKEGHQGAKPVKGDVERPWGLAILEDGRFAVTSSTSNCIILGDINGSKAEVIETARKYRGVACGGNSTLIVSCSSEGDLPASVDIIELTGKVLKTIVNSGKIDHLKCPEYIHMMQGELLIADGETHAVLRLHFPTGKLMAVHTHKDLKNPCQITSDRHGNVYVASKGCRCILAIRADGKWRNLVKADDLRDLVNSFEDIHPHSVTVTTDSQPTLIVGWHNDKWGSAVTRHVKHGGAGVAE